LIVRRRNEAVRRFAFREQATLAKRVAKTKNHRQGIAGGFGGLA